MKNTNAPQCRKTTIPGGIHADLDIHIVEGLRVIREVERNNFGGDDHIKVEVEPDHMKVLLEVAQDGWDLCHTFIRFADDEQGYFGTAYEDGCLIVREVASIEDAISSYAD